MNSIKRKSLILAFSIAFMITGGLLYYFHYNDDKYEPVPTVTITIAATDIPPKSIITEEHLTKVELPEAAILQGSSSNRSQLIGRVTRDTIYSGEQILEQRLIQGRERDGLSVIIDEGYRALTIQVDTVSSVGENVKEGDYVDILAYLPPRDDSGEVIEKVLEKVEVLETQYNQGGAGTKVITFKVTPENGEKIFLMDKLGEIRLALRPIIE
ncbi:pilus assembly protein CpaB [Desulfitispora alkaliphila]|uniref:Flp pilus assembly protein CpaB n=1 Tax=Desulfitispora alkaliphila TaxID=622674 RepID=UPI003D253414